MRPSQDKLALKRKRAEPLQGNSEENLALKRKRAESSLSNFDRSVLSTIRERGSSAIWKNDIKRETKLPNYTFNKALKNLLNHALIKEVSHVKNKQKKHYMAIEFEPSDAVSGGDWYVNGELDRRLISDLTDHCLMFLTGQRVATAKEILNYLKKAKSSITMEQGNQILKFLVLTNEIIEVKSTGLGDSRSILVGEVCYRVAPAELTRGSGKGAMASTPCGVCPRISQCTPDGVISPSTCVYYPKWLDTSDELF